MPFVSKMQLKACYAQKSRAKKEGRPFNWDCSEWYKETENFDKLPLYKTSPKKPKKTKTKKSSSKKQTKLKTGVRGGVYYINSNGNKTYVK